MSNLSINTAIASSDFAARQAVSLFQWLQKNTPIEEVRAAFENMGHEDCVEFEAEHAYFIQNLIRIRDVSRQLQLVRTGRDTDVVSVGLLVAFTVIATLRVKRLIELEIELSQTLNPNSRSHVVCEKTYEFAQRAARLQHYEWPEPRIDEIFANAARTQGPSPIGGLQSSVL